MATQALLGASVVKDWRQYGLSPSIHWRPKITIWFFCRNPVLAILIFCPSHCYLWLNNIYSSDKKMLHKGNFPEAHMQNDFVQCLYEGDTGEHCFPKLLKFSFNSCLQFKMRFQVLLWSILFWIWCSSFSQSWLSTQLVSFYGMFHVIENVFCKADLNELLPNSSLITPTCCIYEKFWFILKTALTFWIKMSLTFMF